MISERRSGGIDAGAGFDREAVERLLADMPDLSQNRPALQKLTTDQRELLARFIDGFESRREFLLWSKDAAILSLGELDGEWVITRAFSGSDMSALIVSDERERWARNAGETLSQHKARTLRRGVAALDVLPACQSAYRRLRWSATEYVNDESDSFRPDARDQKHPAMRPALSELDNRQEWALRRLLEGFDSEDAILAWLQVLTEASAAEVSHSLAERIFAEGHTRSRLLSWPEDSADGPFFRESFAARYLLPPFARAAREVGERAGELAEREQHEHTDTLI